MLGHPTDIRWTFMFSFAKTFGKTEQEVSENVKMA